MKTIKKIATYYGIIITVVFINLFRNLGFHPGFGMVGTCIRSLAAIRADEVEQIFFNHAQLLEKLRRTIPGGVLFSIQNSSWNAYESCPGTPHILIIHVTSNIAHEYAESALSKEKLPFLYKVTNP